MCVCACVRVFVFMNACVRVCVLCTHMDIHAHTACAREQLLHTDAQRVCLYVRVGGKGGGEGVCVCACMFMYACVCVCVCVCVYVRVCV